jgi:hypothetical protein
VIATKVQLMRLVAKFSFKEKEVEILNSIVIHLWLDRVDKREPIYFKT